MLHFGQQIVLVVFLGRYVVNMSQPSPITPVLDQCSQNGREWHHGVHYLGYYSGTLSYHWNHWLIRGALPAPNFKMSGSDLNKMEPESEFQ